MNYKSVFHLILVRDNRVLLMRRDNTGMMDGYWSSISGKIEEGELPTQMLKREAMEEVGIVVENMHFNNCLALICPAYPDSTQTYAGLEVFFTASEWRGEVTNKEPHKHGVLEWYPCDDLPSNTVPAIALGIHNLKKGIIFQEKRT